MSDTIEIPHVIQDIVARGAELLDKAKPGWAEEIDMGELELSCPGHCILGQLFGDFCFGVDELCDAGLMEDSFASPYGFDLSFDKVWDQNDNSYDFGLCGKQLYDLLQVEWIKQINQRLPIP